jgi:hypothetical protein
MEEQHKTKGPASQVWQAGIICYDLLATTGPPMTADRKKRVNLEADINLEIDPGLILPKGIYPAIETQLPVSAFSGLTAWTAPEYSLVLNEEQIAEMGGDPTSHGITEEFDVTNFVLTHRLKLV